MILTEVLNVSMIDSKLTFDEKKLLKQLILENPTAFHNITVNINKILLDGKINIGNIPQMILIISSFFKNLNYNSNDIDILKLVEFISNTILDSGIWPLPEIEIEILKSVVDTSIKLLDSNLGSIEIETKNTCFRFWRFCCK